MEEVEEYKDNLKGMLVILREHIGLLPVEDDEEQIVQWYSELNNSLKDESPFAVMEKKNYWNVLPQLLMLLREVLLTQRWKDVAQILSTVMDNPSVTADAIYPIGLSLVQADDRFLEQFSNLLSMLDKNFDDFRQVLINTALVLVTNGNVKEAQLQLKTMKRKPKERTTERLQCLEALCNANQGLISYMEWLTSKVWVEKLQGHESDYKEEIINTSESMRKDAQRACDYFKGLEERAGTWDIYLVKYLQLLEYYDDIDGAMKVSQTYADKHAQNPNAVRYLYDIYKKGHVGKQNCMEVLQKFCATVPSDELALELHELLIEKGEPASKTLPALFELLDYPCWQTVEAPWQCLADQLMQIYDLREEADTNVVQACWSSRSTWWPSYHFRLDQVSTDIDTSTQLAMYKGVISALLLGKANDYTKTSLENHQFTEEQRRKVKMAKKLANRG